MEVGAKRKEGVKNKEEGPKRPRGHTGVTKPFNITKSIVEALLPFRPTTMMSSGEWMQKLRNEGTSYAIAGMLNIEETVLRQKYIGASLHKFPNKIDKSDVSSPKYWKHWKDIYKWDDQMMEEITQRERKRYDEYIQDNTVKIKDIAELSKLSAETETRPVTPAEEREGDEGEDEEDETSDSPDESMAEDTSGLHEREKDIPRKVSSDAIEFREEVGPASSEAHKEGSEVHEDESEDEVHKDAVGVPAAASKAIDEDLNTIPFAMYGRNLDHYGSLTRLQYNKEKKQAELYVPGPRDAKPVIGRDDNNNVRVLLGIENVTILSPEEHIPVRVEHEAIQVAPDREPIFLRLLITYEKK